MLDKKVEARRKYDREWKKRKYSEDFGFREREKERKRKWRVDFPWLSHLKAARERCNNPNHVYYERYGGRGIEALLTQGQIKMLYLRDRAGQMEQPSIDRIDNDESYCFENCRFIEVVENRKRGQSIRHGKEEEAALGDISI